MEAVPGTGSSVTTGVGISLVGTSVTLGVCARPTISPKPPTMMLDANTIIKAAKPHFLAFIFNILQFQSYLSADGAYQADTHTITDGTSTLHRADGGFWVPTLDGCRDAGSVKNRRRGYSPAAIERQM
jgi:hypothetical protein